MATESLEQIGARSSLKANVPRSGQKRRCRELIPSSLGAVEGTEKGTVGKDRWRGCKRKKAKNGPSRFPTFHNKDGSKKM